MLSSTADRLYWMARSMERAENTARMLDITYRMSLLKHATQEPYQEWSAILSISGLHYEFRQRHREITADAVLHFMALDESNPSSIVSSLNSARENGRAERGAITSEMWEALNHTWLLMREKCDLGIPADGVSAFFDWVKERSHLSRGIAYGTLLRGDAFRFIRLGTFIERADNTIRILDVKYHILLPSLKDIGGVADYYQWGALLRSVSAFEAYRKVYRDAITPKRVAELLILNADMPRSLNASLVELDRVVCDLNGHRGARGGELRRRVGMLHAELMHGSIDDIMATGLHEYLTGALARIYAIGDEITRTYFWSMDDWPNEIESLQQTQTSSSVAPFTTTGAEK
ncbi:MAG TPA: alpha-E domain-containing protein [Rhodocyclaceae bacterium]|nr:alpha-E domain-containing protein [Rhodocyclaceae bacterium]